MTNYEVLSINPSTKSPERMPFEKRTDAEAHIRRAIRDGRLFVEIISSPEEHEAWRMKARWIVAEL